MRPAGRGRRARLRPRRGGDHRRGAGRCGRAEPVAATYLAARLLALAAPQAAPAVALAEEARLVCLAEGDLRAENGRLHGALHHVPPAETVLVATEGLLLALPAEAAEGADHLRVDGVIRRRLDLSGVAAERLAGGEPLDAALRQARAETRLVIAAELLSHAEVMLDLTLEHLRTRRQFGQSLGHFQALQHKAVDLYGQTLLSRAVLDAALAAAAGGLAPDDLDRAACRARARVNDTAMAVARGAIQMFGALGITDESPLSPHIRRVLALAPWLGSSAELRRQYARIGRVLTRSTAAKEAAA